MKKHNYVKQPAYKRWVLARDKALEVLHLNAQLQSTDFMRAALTQVLLQAKAHFYSIKTAPHAIDQFEKQVHETLREMGFHLFELMVRLRGQTYLLAKTSETEILAQLNKKIELTNSVTKSDIHHKRSQGSVAGGPLLHRIQLYMDRLARRIVNQAQSSALNAKDLDAFLIDVVQSFPSRKVFKRVPRILKPSLMEADDKTKVDAAIDNIDESEWDSMVQDYLSEYIPQWRAPEYIIDIPVTDPTITSTGEEVWYAWEFERDLTNEFVKSVRDGQVDAATAAGITDFVVIAIIDGKTCDSCCGNYGCSDFDGMLVSEIEKMTGGEYSVVPYHFFCRCTMAPATDSIPDQPSLDDKDFESWLNS